MIVNVKTYLSSILFLYALSLVSCSTQNIVHECEDVDCGHYGVCSVLDGEATCFCANDYHAKNMKCVPDEGSLCYDMDCGEHARCMIFNEAAFCQCDDAYHMESNVCVDNTGTTCESVDCGAYGNCYIQGTYTGCQCSNGYYDTGSTCALQITCEEDSSICHEEATCIDIGPYQACQCKEGYRGDGTNCSDIDECTTGLEVCSEQATCTNLTGSYSCTCPSGLVGSGFVCVDPSVHNIGINLFASQLDYVEDRMFADVMKTARGWTTPGEYGHGDPTLIDEQGWPLEDAEVVVWHGIDNMNGTYALEGDSNSEPTIQAGYGGGQIQNLSFSNGHFTADFVYSDTGSNGLLLTFRNTGGGVKNVTLMRPQTVGGATPYDTSVTFTNQIKEMTNYFNVIRFMWAVDAWNGAWQIAWEDRVQPDYCSYNRGDDSNSMIGWAGKGMPWEVAIQFANETGKDLWINMPLGANDSYIRKLAQLFKNTYTVPDGKIYWEYSNEATWDASGTCSGYLRNMGEAEAATDGPVGYDGSDNVLVLSARYYAKRAAEMSLIWREVWGDEAMMKTIRPIASGQLSYDTELLWGLEFVHNWFGNNDGDHVVNPHPVNYFFYGCGGSHYTGDDPEDIDISDGSTEIVDFEAYEEEEACLARMYGLQRTAYEGGVWTNENNYQLERITDAMIAYHNLWNKYGNDLFVYYVTTGGEENGTALGFTTDAYNLETCKYTALEQILSEPKSAVTAGTLVPATIPGGDYSINSTAWEHPAPGGQVTAGGAQFDEWRIHKGYLFRVEEARNYSVTLSFTNTTDAHIEIMVDGVVITNEIMSGTTSPSYTVSLTEGLHAIRVKKLNDGYFYLNEISIL